ncbi:hypothetical protein LOK49_LG05G01806 [Camellia lanceoleosa]|uniref:Uncharacterized protein n=1 Tax=Camellia lanceoleosa TaxID=1840588 RepID=A0ACC0HQG0_9ERIC|nr:hypothetical protein LOK49_LG05G01806 [Camellia lanceoleosa]
MEDALSRRRWGRKKLIVDSGAIPKSRIVKKWCMNGLGSVGVAKVQDFSIFIIKGGRRLSANAYLALELVQVQESASPQKKVGESCWCLVAATIRLYRT